MPVESKPLFHPEVIRQRLLHFALPPSVEESRERLRHWADLIASGRADALKETDLLPDFLTDIFVNLLGYTRPAQAPDCHTLSRETQVVVDGQKVDAVLGRFRPDGQEYVVAVEGKGTRDPLEIPFAGRKMSAVDQCYRYAINLPCDWIIVTSMRETRLYHKGSNQQTYERFDTVRLATDDGLLRRFVFLLGAARVVPPTGECHFKDLLAQSETVGREITNRFYAFYADLRLSVFARLREENSAVPAGEILRCSQKLLDRILFCAFCEDRALLPPETVRGAFEHADPYNPRPIWENFRGLFRSVDQGNPALKIPAYNGGLFAHDPGLDSLTVPDDICALFRDLAAHDFRPARLAAESGTTGEIRPVIDVDILGHIFEQSITDLERIRQDIETGSLPTAGKDARYGPLGKAESGGKLGSDEPLIPQIPTDFTDKDLETSGFSGSQCVSGSMGESSKEIAPRQQAGATAILLAKDARTRRKQEGAFYTPAFITRYIVGQTLGAVLDARFETLRTTAEAAAAATARKALADPAAYDPATLNDPQRKALVAFWESWQEVLKRLRILDPACGSGAFLIEAFDQLHAYYENANARLEELRGERTLFDPGRSILQHNLYGVDLNPEAVQICQLSLWIKTAAHGKALTSLDHSIREGNSVVADPAIHPKAFDWQAAFPDVFAQGGFDVVIGNPPYIRQEWLAPFKPYWEKRYRTYHGVADIFVYFFEQGLELLRPGGQLAFITSGSWVRGNFGAPLRKYLAGNSRIASMVDFGEFQPFEDAEMIRPSITIVAKDPPGGEMKLYKWLTSGRPPETLADEIAQAPVVSASRFDSDCWELEPDSVIALLQKIVSNGKPLHALPGVRIYRGVLSGLTEAFVISATVRDQLVSADPRSAEIIKPFAQGTNLRPWYIEDCSDFLIFARRGINIDNYPAVREYLTNFRTQLEPKPTDWNDSHKWAGRKAGAYAWYEIQDTVDYWQAFEQPKVVWPDISKLPRFSIDSSNRYLGNTGYFVPTADLYLLGILSSWTTWFFISKKAQPLRLRGDRWQYRLFSQSMEHIPIPDAPPAEREAIAELARTCGTLAQERYQGQIKVQRRLLQAFGEGSGNPLNQKASAWWELSLNPLGEALKQSFKLKANPMKSPRVADDWESYLTEQRAHQTRLTAAISAAEADLNARVYRLFNLTPEEIKLLEKEVEH